METVKFRTNIGCTDCLKVAAILLNADPQILYWNIDMSHPDRLLIVKGWMLNPFMVVYNLRFAGFQAESIEEMCSRYRKPLMLRGIRLQQLKLSNNGNHYYFHHYLPCMRI